ncbi:hypothetical protein HAL07_00810 [Helicobacter ailurogastricus]|uniref:Uncharacterized protein n=1 Tax=Helicobacter ailurogastricus TaxID=1578720 RepID=A0A0K2Y4A0_9HELI|nr:hypothetical protein HAL07_00810 [Helicobacter ailurogastricus]
MRPYICFFTISNLEEVYAKNDKRNFINTSGGVACTFRLCNRHGDKIYG